MSQGNLLINTRTTLISAGTERMLIGFSKASYLEKARQQPEKVKMVLEKVKKDGLFSTLDAISTTFIAWLLSCWGSFGRGMGATVDDFKARKNFSSVVMRLCYPQQRVVLWTRGRLSH